MRLVPHDAGILVGVVRLSRQGWSHVRRVPRQRAPWRRLRARSRCRLLRGVPQGGSRLLERHARQDRNPRCSSRRFRHWIPRDGRQVGVGRLERGSLEVARTAEDIRGIRREEPVPHRPRRKRRPRPARPVFGLPHEGIRCVVDPGRRTGVLFCLPQPDVGSGAGRDTRSCERAVHDVSRSARRHQGISGLPQGETDSSEQVQIAAALASATDRLRRSRSPAGFIEAI